MNVIQTLDLLVVAMMQIRKGCRRECGQSIHLRVCVGLGILPQFSQIFPSFSNQQHFSKELMPHRAFVLLIASRNRYREKGGG